MGNSELVLYLGEDWNKVKALLQEVLHSDVELLDNINTGLLQHSGKMLRPMLTICMARAANGGATNDDVLRNAASVEILHNATLLHDDVADNAPTRRGIPTVMSELGPVPAVLVGDFWLARAVGLISSSKHLGWALSEYARTLTDLAEGEMLQQEKAFKADTTVEDYLRIIHCKTASLFMTACRTGVRSVDGSDELLDAAGRFGRALGMAFQIRDDVLDYSGGDQIGKPVGIDLREQKITLPLLGALAQSPREKEIRKMIQDIPEHPEYCEKIHNFVLESGGVEYAGRKLEAFEAEALDALEAFPASRGREVLAFLVNNNSNRRK